MIPFIYIYTTLCTINIKLPPVTRRRGRRQDVPHTLLVRGGGDCCRRRASDDSHVITASPAAVSFGQR